MSLAAEFLELRQLSSPLGGVEGLDAGNAILSRDSDAAQTLRHSHANARRGSRPRAIA